MCTLFPPLSCIFIFIPLFYFLSHKCVITFAVHLVLRSWLPTDRRCLILMVECWKGNLLYLLSLLSLFSHFFLLLFSLNHSLFAPTHTHNIDHSLSISLCLAWKCCVFFFSLSRFIVLPLYFLYVHCTTQCFSSISVSLFVAIVLVVVVDFHRFFFASRSLLCLHCVCSLVCIHNTIFFIHNCRANAMCAQHVCMIYKKFRIELMLRTNL